MIAVVTSQGALAREHDPVLNTFGHVLHEGGVPTVLMPTYKQKIYVKRSANSFSWMRINLQNEGKAIEDVHHYDA